MSKYTTEIRYICETEAGYADSKGYIDIDTILTEARSKIFDFSYPIWDNSYKSVLEKKILKHYYTREIGFETVGLWKLKLQTRLQEIMPYYNKLYETTVLDFNPLYDVDLTTTHEGTGTNSGTDTTELSGDVAKKTTGGYTDSPSISKTTTFNNLQDRRALTGNDVTSTTGEDITRDLYSDTPQGGLTGVENQEYLTNARKITDTKGTDVTTDYGKIDTNVRSGSYTVQDGGTNTRTYQALTDTTSTAETHAKIVDMENTDEYIHKVVGKSAGISYSKLIEDFRKTIINIDMRIINDLSDLFFGLW